MQELTDAQNHVLEQVRKSNGLFATWQLKKPPGCTAEQAYEALDSLRSGGFIVGAGPIGMHYYSVKD